MSLTFSTNDYLEYYLTLVGWLINNGIWNAIMDSGLFALPFLTIYVQEWLKARGEGADEGNKGVLSAMRIDNRTWIAMLVVMLCLVPAATINLSTLRFDSSRSAQCQVQVPQPTDTGWGQSFTTLNDKTAQVPLWWAFVHVMSKAITGAAVAAIPCGTDLRQMRMEVNNTRINDPVLAQEVADFTRDCYGASRAKLFMNRVSLPENRQNDVNWIGSHYFQETAGYYNTFHASRPYQEWPYDATRDAGLPKLAGGGGYPTCNQWWADAGHGLRARLLAQVKPDLLTRMQAWANHLSAEEVNDAIVREVVAPRNQRMTQGQVYTDYGGQIDGTVFNGLARAGGTVGLAVGSLAYFPAMDVVRQALPMVLSFLKMALVICIPLVLLFGVYELKAAITLSIVQFALLFVDFWFQLARWIDSTILDALYGWSSPHLSLNPVMGLNNATGDAILNFVMGAMFLVLPAFWIGALSWAGISIGGAIEKGLNHGTAGAEKAGSQGGQIAEKVIKK